MAVAQRAVEAAREVFAQRGSRVGGGERIRGPAALDRVQAGDPLDQLMALATAREGSRRFGERQEQQRRSRSRRTDDEDGPVEQRAGGGQIRL